MEGTFGFEFIIRVLFTFAESSVELVIQYLGFFDRVCYEDASVLKSWDLIDFLKLITPMLEVFLDLWWQQ